MAYKRKRKKETEKMSEGKQNGLYHCREASIQPQHSGWIKNEICTYYGNENDC